MVGFPDALLSGKNTQSSGYMKEILRAASAGEYFRIDQSRTVQVNQVGSPV